MPRVQPKIIKSSSARVKLHGPFRLRPLRKGPESALVSAFLAEFPLRPLPNHAVTVFREPELESGSPDVVAVIWHKQATAKWPSCRAELGIRDIRIAHWLHVGGPRAETAVIAQWGVKSIDSLERLRQSSMAYQRSGLWHLKSPSSIFAVRKILAFEAKMGAKEAVLAQAVGNRWFASTSYVLLPKRPLGEGFTRTAYQIGVGIWINGEQNPIHSAAEWEKRQPLSYASWLFNDWVWRSSFEAQEE